MIVSDFTKPELDIFRENCNFVGFESNVFELRSRGIPLEEIAEVLNMSVENVKRISCRGCKAHEKAHDFSQILINTRF